MKYVKRPNHHIETPWNVSVTDNYNYARCQSGSGITSDQTFADVELPQPILKTESVTLEVAFASSVRTSDRLSPKTSISDNVL